VDNIVCERAIDLMWTFEQHPLITFLESGLNPSNLDGLYRLSSSEFVTGILLNIRSRYTSFRNDLIASWEHEFDYFNLIFLSFFFAGTAQLFVGSLLGKMTTEKMNGLFQMDGTWTVLMSCLSRPLDLP
jgi:hypothetical protein